MGGGLLQLVAYGAQDAYISGNPQITFWKGLFKRHTNFAMEPFRINFSGQVQWGTKQTALIGRHADLLYSTYVEVTLPSTTAAGDDYFWNNNNDALGYNLIRHVELDIGGQIIDRMYSEFMFLWGHLTKDFTSSLKLSQLLSGPCKDGPGPSRLNYGTECGADGRQQNMNTFYIPLPFFFTRNPGAALPLIALQYHEVKINVLWNEPQFIAGNFTKSPVTTEVGEGIEAPPIQDLPEAIQAALYIDYIYLDTEERRRMAQASHEYLIEQTQFNEDKGITGASNRIDLTFNHPVKELIWVVQPSYYTDCRLAAGMQDVTALTPFTYSTNPVFDQWLQINGQDRLDRRYGDYYNRVQPYQHHTGTLGFTARNMLLLNALPQLSLLSNVSAYMYSFALRPEEHQPSGTCNFSRIDTATIVMNMASLPGPYAGVAPNPGLFDPFNWNVRVYAVNYNVLRVMSGMGGLAYSN